MIVKGVNIGKDAVIAARCVVTKDVPDGATVACNQMKIIGSAYE
jgi:acetyltransferase-like isoleucine patch superfamily enzyme